MTGAPLSAGARNPPALQYADRALDAAATVFLAVSEGLLALMVVLNIVNVTLRNFGGGSLLWVWPWTSLMMVWSVFLGFFVIYRRNLDVSLVFFTARMSPAFQRWLALLNGLCGVLLVGVLLAEGPAIFERQVGAIELVGLERYAMSVPLLASCALLLVHFALEIVKAAAGYEIPLASADEEVHQW